MEKLKKWTVKRAKRENKQDVLFDVLGWIYEDVMEKLGFPVVGDIIVGTSTTEEGHPALYVKEDYSHGERGHRYGFEVYFDLKKLKIDEFYRIKDNGEYKQATTEGEKEAKRELGRAYKLFFEKYGL